MDVVVVTLPPSCTTIHLGATAYHNCGGAYYVKVETGFQVVPAPVGAMVQAVPDGATAKTVGGSKYFVFGGAYFRPFYSNGAVIYQIVADPSAGWPDRRPRGRVGGRAAWFP